MKKTILFFLGCIAPLLLHAQTAYDFMAVNGDGIRMYYKISDPVNHYVSLTNGDGGNVNPHIVDPYSEQVRVLGINTINVPEKVQNGGITYQVKSIGPWALFYDFNTKNIILPEGLEAIEESAFYIMYGVENINFPSTLKTIKSQAFSGAREIKNFDLSQTQVTELNNVFNLNLNVEKIIFPETLKTIRGRIGFSAADNFTSVTIPAAVETIGSFQGDNLNTIYMNPANPPTPADGNLRINSTATIYVPIDATQAYENAAQWSNYKGKYRERITIGGNGYSTLYLANENFTVPTGCEAFVIESITQSTTAGDQDKANATKYPAGSIIPAGQAVIIKGVPGQTYEYQANVSGTEVTITNNMLIGSATDQTINAPGYDYYLFGYATYGQGFYRQTGHTLASISLKAHKAGLRVPKSSSGSAKSFVINFDEAKDGTKNAAVTAIKALATEKPETNIVYDLQGRRVQHPTKGIYIVNGKKTVFK